MNAPARQLQDARQLHRLRELRERQALNALRQAESQVAAAEQAVAERQRAMDRLQQQRDALSQRIVGDCAARLGRLAATGEAPAAVCARARRLETFQPDAGRAASFSESHARWRRLAPFAKEIRQ